MFEDVGFERGWSGGGGGGGVVVVNSSRSMFGLFMSIVADMLLWSGLKIFHEFPEQRFESISVGVEGFVEPHESDEIFGVRDHIVVVKVFGHGHDFSRAGRGRIKLGW